MLAPKLGHRNPLGCRYFLVAFRKVPRWRHEGTRSAWRRAAQSPSMCAAACPPTARACAALPPRGSQAAAAAAARAQSEETPLHEFAAHSTSEAAVAMVIAAYPEALKAKTEVRRCPSACP